ncbi:MAG: tRNA lysidine(34) synthetase TilS [Planctomycetota bacterium]|jgi:tRNA(Ile)-lysidine synthase
MDDLERKVCRFVRARNLMGDGGKVVVAFSGGPDSVALTLILSSLSAEGRLPVTLHLAHLNHRLRGAEADQDEEFCRRFADEHCLPIEVETIDVAAAARQQGLSVEAAAREARYGFLARVAGNLGSDIVATAHHADDVAETVLLRMLRGAGVTGLGALPPSRPLCAAQPDVRLVRPLLEVRKAELLTFLKGKGQDFRVDSSNLDTGYARNEVRHELIPLLEREFPGFSVGSLCALNAAAVEVAGLVESLLDKHWDRLCQHVGPGEVALDSVALADAPAALRKAAVARALKALGPPGKAPPLRREHYEALAALPGREVGVEVSLPRGLFARREHGLVYISRRGPTPAPQEWDLPVPGSVELTGMKMTVACDVLQAGAVRPDEAADRSSRYEVYLDAGAAGAPLKVRQRRAGDSFHPLGAPGATKLKKYLIGRKVPRHVRDDIPLVTTLAGEIAWVVGYQIGERFKLDRSSAAALQLRADAAAAGGNG